MFPGFFVHTMAKQMKLYNKSGLTGFFLEHSCELTQPYLNDQLEMYVTWKLATDASVNVDKLIDKFFTRYYGKAAGQMKQLYLDIENTYIDPNNYPEYVRDVDMHRHQTREIACEYLATSERLAKYVGWIKEARAAASTELERQRVDNFNKALIQPMITERE
jgi:hypothetical protein